jgi:methylated-DNA-[protein]-cysteine S-methyltransferase
MTSPSSTSSTSITASAYSTVLDSPLGAVTLRGTDIDGDFALTGLWMDEHRHGPVAAERASWTVDHGPFGDAIDQLTAYFAGDRQIFDLRLHAPGTPFQQQVWAVLATIPYAQTWSYLDVAEAIGNPQAVRAVGAANGRNPISIIVPCHRVVGSDGSMTGYGGGLDNKRWLLAHERRVSGVALF